MKYTASVIILLIAFLIPATAETLDGLLARLLAEDSIEAHGAYAQLGDARPVTGKDGPRDISEWVVSDVMVLTSRGQRRTTLVANVYNRGQADESAFIADGEASWKQPQLDTQEQVSRARVAIRAMIAGAIPIPAQPTAQLPFDVSKPTWAGQTITAYAWPSGTHVASDGPVASSDVILTLSVDGSTTVRVTVAADTGYFIVEPVE